MLKNETNRATLREISGQALIIPLCDVKKWGNYPMKIVIEGISFYFENSYYRIIQHISNKQKFGNVFPRSMREYPFSRERVKFPSNKKARIVSLDQQRRFVAPIRSFPQRSPLVPSKYSQKGGTSTLGLLNTSQFSERQSHLTNAMNHHKLGACSKRPLFHPTSPCTPRRAFPRSRPRRGFGAFPIR